MGRLAVTWSWVRRIGSVIVLTGGLAATGPATAQSVDRELNPYMVRTDIRDPFSREAMRLGQIQQAARMADARGQFTVSEPLWREARVIVSGVWGPNHIAMADVLTSLADSLAGQGRYADADPLYRRSLEIYVARVREREHLYITALAAGDVATNLMQLYRFEDAMPFIEQQRRVYERIRPRNHPDIAIAIAKAAFAQDALTQFDQAAQSYQRALAMMEAAREQRPDAHATVLNNYALTLMHQQRWPEAGVALRGALAMRERVLPANHPDIAQTWLNIAGLYNAEGKFDDAEEASRRALEMLEQSLTADSGEARPDLALARQGFAGTLAGQGRLPEAKAMYRRAADGLPAQHPLRVLLLNDLAMTMQGQGRLQDAEPIFREAIALARTADADRPEVSVPVLHNLSLNLLLQQRPGEAEQIERQAYAIVLQRLGPDHPAGALPLNSLAELAAMQGRAEEAERLHRQGLALSERTFGAESDTTANAARGLAAFLLAQNRPADAIVVARATYGAVPSDHSGSLTARAAWETRAADDPARLREAFLAVQAMHSAAASDALLANAAQIAAREQGAGALANQWRAARERLEDLDTQIAAAAQEGAAGDTRRRTLAGERATVQTQARESEARLRAAAPRFFELIASPAAPLADVQARLHADEALIVLTPGDQGLPEGHRRGLIFAVTREGAAWAEAPMEPDALRAEIAALHDQLRTTGATRSPGGAIATQRGFDRARAHRLYTALFGEVAGLVSGKARWTLAPQGALLTTPFAALVTQAPSGSDLDADALRNTAWLGFERTLSITPSVAALIAQRRTAVSAGANRTPFFGVGAPEFTGAPNDVGRVADARALYRNGVVNVAAVRGLNALPQTGPEIEALAAALGATRADYLLGAEATEAAIGARNADRRLERAEVIAFATHGLVANAFEGLSEPALALTPPAVATAGDDGLLTASEAARLRLNARWVILSACDTASGGGPNAEGLTGLARAFFYAGARALLVSQWPVDDTAARLLTTDAVERQRRTPGLSAAAAMREAMIALARTETRDAEGRSFAHPRNWAPFILVSGE